MSTTHDDARRGPREAAPPQLAPPESTYRLQFHKAFTFRDATAVTDYLADLGVTHAYASPYLAARPGSTHGYDLIDHCRLNPEVGTPQEYEAWVAALRRRGMGHILDTVPNHVGVGTNDNKWWNDVLEHGKNSRFAGYFDIDWNSSQRPELVDKVLLPVLGGRYGDVLEKGELRLARDDDGKFVVYYYDRRFPIDPQTYPKVEDGDVVATLARYNGKPGDPRSWDALDELLERQHYRLSYWRVAPDEINYRRFFDINDLAALSVERQDVFDATHSLIFQLLREGKVAGLRIDHPDGLFDPKQYFERLQQRYARELSPGADDAAVAKLAGERPLYVVAEKILAIDEPLPREWACDGTSGYDFLVMANALFVDASSAEAFTTLYADWIGERIDFEDLVYEKKRLILQISLASELHVLAHQLDRLAQRDRHTRDFTFAGLHAALREVIACFPVYRSYVTPQGTHESDVRNTQLAVERAIERNPKSDPSAFRFVGDMVLLRSPAGFDEDAKAAQRKFAGKFQQVTAPTTAKGIEDTAFYIYNRFVSLNEVGGEPQRFGVAPEAMHRYLADRQQLWPHALSALSTHDTKRSEDLRARLNVLSEIPDAWREHATRWAEANASLRGEADARPAPSRNDEYLLYQTLVGAWPLGAEAADDTFVARIQAYMTKATREAKVFTSWTNPNEAYEKGVGDFVAKILSHGPFLEDFLPFVRRVSHLGLLNSLSQTMLKLTAPGVPDTYQGTELWDFSLVDPDNRRPVDYEHRRRLLSQYVAPRTLLEHLSDGRAKLQLVRRMLLARSVHTGLFSEGEYLPVDVTGEKRDHVFAFVRRRSDVAAVVVLPRLPARLLGESVDLPLGPDVWGDTRVVLPVVEGREVWHDGMTNQSIRAHRAGENLTLRVADVLANFPVALLLP